MKEILLKLRTGLCLLTCFLCLQTSAQQSFKWANGFGGNAGDQGWGIAADDQGYSFTTGFFNGTAYFGNDSIVSAGGTDACIARLDPDGNILWVKRMGGTDAEWGRGIAVDASGNAYCTGNFGLTADFGNVSLSAQGSSDIFVVKIDASGNILWAKSFGGKSQDIGWGIDTDDQGFVYVTGSFADTAHLGNHTIISNGANDIFVTKLDSSGNVIWAKALGGTATEIPRGIAVANDGNIHLTGYLVTSTFATPPSSTYFDTIGPIISNNNSQDIFIAKLDTLGNAIWARQMGSRSMDQGFGVTVDHLGNVFGTGMFQSTGYFGTDSFVSYTNEIYVTKWDKDGNYEWARQFGSTSGDYGYGVDVDLAGNVYATGFYNRTVDFDPGPESFDLVASSNSNEIFVLKLNTEGNFVWAKSMGGKAADAASAIAVNRSGHVFITGLFTDTADFNPGPDSFKLISKRNAANTGFSNDIFIAKLSCHPDSSSFHAETVCGEGFTINDSTYFQDGTYTVILTGLGGCDSVVTFNLTLLPPSSAEINIEEFTLGTTLPFVSYQWILNGAPIPGATNSTYTVTENGNYQVVVIDENGCTDTSDIYVVNNVSIDDVNTIVSLIYIYPNPANESININSPASVNIVLTGIDGRKILSRNDVSSISVKELVDGVYFLHILDKDGHLLKVEKIVKQ